MTHLTISAAFSSYEENQCYLFVKNEYVVVKYNTGVKKEESVDGPILVSSWLPLLVNTPFEYLVDAAFEINTTEAFIFSGNQCCKIQHDPKHENSAKILEGPMSIVSMFPYLKDTVFVHGIDAGILGRGNNVFLFKGSMCGHINLVSKTRLGYKSIRSAFPSWVGTVFEHGIDAAFATSSTTEAYIFKGNYYAHISFNQVVGGSDSFTGNIKYILDDWTCLREVLELDY